jgi:hypothetical protein
MKPNEPHQRDKDNSSFQAFIRSHQADIVKEIATKAAQYKAKDTYLADKTIQNLISHGQKTEQEQLEEIDSYQKQNVSLESKIEQYQGILGQLSLTNKVQLSRAFNNWVQYTNHKILKVKRNDYISKFYQRGQKLRSMKNWKMFTLLLGKTNLVESLQAQLSNFENDLSSQRSKELELLTQIKHDIQSQIAIETRKCTIMKHQLDQALLRGAYAFSMEALKISQSNLKELVGQSSAVHL